MHLLKDIKILLPKTVYVTYFLKSHIYVFKLGDIFLLSF